MVIERTTLEVLMIGRDQLTGKFVSAKKALEEFKKSSQMIFTQAALKNIKESSSITSALGDTFRNVGNSMVDTGNKMINWGKNTQWLGRQLLYNITLPLIGIGILAVKTALDIEKQWVRVEKVYVDTAEEAVNFANVKKDILIPAVDKLSVKFAQHKKIVVEVMSEWAAMGKKGQELADITEETFRIMRLGELDMADATNTIRTLMATYGLTIKEVAKELNAFNTIENTTSLRFKDLVQAFPEVVAVFKSFNMTAREGAALLAGMHERGLDAKESAHALKFTLTRLQAPTKQAMDLFKKYNIEIFDANGKMKAGIPIIKELAKKLNQMSEEEKAVFISTVAGRRQFVRFAQALESTLDPASAFSRALEASADDMGNAENAQRELNTILESGPVKVERLWVEIKNLAAELGDKLLPYLLKGMEYLKGLFDWFDKLSPSTKEWIIKIAILTALLGPFLIIIASFVEVFGFLWKIGGKVFIIFSDIFYLISGNIAKLSAFGKVINFITTKALPAMGKAIVFLLTNPIGWLIIAVAVLAYILITKWDTIKEGLKVLGEFFINVWTGIISFLGGVYNKIAGFLQGILDWFISLPGKILAIWNNLPYLLGYIIGYTLGLLVRLVLAGINAIVWVFTDLIPRILDILAQVWTGILQWGVNLIKSMAEIGYKALVAIINWIAQLPGRFVNFIAQLPHKIAEFIPEVWNRAKQFGEAVWKGIKEFVEKIPGIVMDAINGAINAVKNAVGAGWDAAKNFGKGIWDGFRKGMGMTSPSFIEEALNQISANAISAVQQLNSSVNNINSIAGSILPDINISQKTAIQQKEAIQKPITTSGSTIIRNYNIEIKAGTMIATKGEQREFVRTIKKLLQEEERRYAY